MKLATSREQNATPIETIVLRMGAILVASDSLVSISELDDRIAIIRDNIRQLVEQAAAVSGGADEVRNSDRIEQQTTEMQKLIESRVELLKKR